MDKCRGTHLISFRNLLEHLTISVAEISYKRLQRFPRYYNVRPLNPTPQTPTQLVQCVIMLVDSMVSIIVLLL